MRNDPQHSENNQPISNPLIEQLRRDMQTPGPWARRFRALAEAIVNAGELKTRLTCREVQEVLDVYLSDELKGHDVRLAYPEVWQHIQTCANCQYEHDTLLDALSERDREDVPDFTPVPRPLSFLQPKDDHARWISSLTSRLAGASFGLHILLNPDFLRKKLGFGSPLQTAGTRRSEIPEISSEPRALLIDHMPFDGQRLTAEIAVARAENQTDLLTLLATLTGNAPLPDHLWIRLTWAGQSYTAPVARVQPDVGYARVEGVSLKQVQEALDAEETHFEIVIETRDMATDDDDTTASD